MRIYVLDGGGPKDSENTINSFLTKCGEKVFWQIGTDMLSWCFLSRASWSSHFHKEFWIQVIHYIFEHTVRTKRICGGGRQNCGGLIPLFLSLGIIFGMPWHYYRRVRRKKDTSLKAMFQPDTEEDPEQKRLGGKAVEGYKMHRKFRYWILL